MGTKSDMDRIGLFSEPTYVTVGDKYQSRHGVAFNAEASKGRQMCGPHNKIRCALQDGYFDKKYVRVFEGESYSDAVKRRRVQRIEAGKRNLTTKAFMPSNGKKEIGGAGNYYGSFSGVITAFPPNLKVTNTPKTTLRNVQTNPGKKGTGFGYTKVTINEFRKHMPDPYDTYKSLNTKDQAAHKGSMKGGAFRLNMYPVDYFDKNPYGTDRTFGPKKGQMEGKNVSTQAFKYSSPGKSMTGDKSGTFEKYPTHSVDNYNPRAAERPVNVVNKTGKLFYPQAFGKSRPVTSVIDQNILKEMNVNNYRSFTTMASLEMANR